MQRASAFRHLGGRSAAPAGAVQLETKLEHPVASPGQALGRSTREEWPELHEAGPLEIVPVTEFIVEIPNGSPAGPEIGRRLHDRLKEGAGLVDPSVVGGAEGPIQRRLALLLVALRRGDQCGLGHGQLGLGLPEGSPGGMKER